MSEQQEPIVYTVYGTTDGASAAPLTESSALTLPAFWSAVRFLSETLASLPKAVYRKDGEIRRRVEGHAAAGLISDRINPYTIPFVVWETFFSHAVTWGNGYLYIGRDRAMQATSLTNLAPDRVMPFRVLEGKAQGQWYLIKTKTKSIPVPAADIIHLPGLGFDGMIGYPVVKVMRETIEAGHNARRFGSKFLSKGTMVKGSVEVPGTATPEQIAQIKLNLLAHQNIDNAHSYLILTSGATLKNSTVPPESSQLIETCTFNVLDLCRILRVAPHHVYELGRATWSNAELMGIETVRYSLRPWIEKTEEELRAKLLSDRERETGHYIHFNLDALLRGDSKTVTDNLIAQCNGGLRTVNEARALLDLPPDADPASSKLRVPVSFPVPGETNQPAKPAKPPEKNSMDAYAALAPVIEAACDRVDSKTRKAFASRAGKPAAERQAWADRFAGEQKAYAIAALEPIDKALRALDAPGLDVPAAAADYAARVRAAADNGSAAGDELLDIVKAALLVEDPVEAKAA